MTVKFGDSRSSMMYRMLTSHFLNILNVRKTTCNAKVYGELGKYPVSVHIKSRMLNYWARLLTGKQTKLCFVMYEGLLKLYNENTFRSPWLSYIKSLLNNSGMSDVWISQDVCNYLWLKDAFERNVKDHWITEWRSLLRAKSS